MKKNLFIFLIISLIFIIGCDSNQNTISVEEDKNNNKEQLTCNIVNKYTEKYNKINLTTNEGKKLIEIN